jgi:hypothetical protein
MINRSLIELQQQNILTSERGLICLPERSHSILTEVLDYDEDILRLALGEFGVRLRDFAYVVDLDHPDVWSSVLFDSEFTDRYSKLLRLVLLARQNGLEECLDGLSKLNIKNLPNHLKYLDTPFKNQQYVRLLPNREDRERVRNTKEICEIELGSFYNKGRSAWEQCPDDFSLYVRNNTAYSEEIEKATKKAERYVGLGCHSMAQKIMESIENFRKIMEEIHYGFHRITLTNAAVILAKLHSYEFSGLLEPGQLFDLDNNRIFVSRNDKSNIYVAKAYPLNELQDYLPFRVKDIVERLEMFDEANGKPIFDHYVVVVPSDESSSSFVDATLIREQAIVPVLLGEKDGKCFFICYFI